MRVNVKKIKIHREGTNVLIMLALVLIALNVPVWMFLPPYVLPAILTLLSALGFSFVFNFFRSPVRHYHGERRNHVLSSVDGHVVAIERVYEPEVLKSDAIMLSVFMTPLNVHANWYPVDGDVIYVKHHSGRFLSAYLPKSSTENERCTVAIRTPEGQTVVARQIAGAMARRIVTYARKGDEASVDEHFGFIKFGSRVDIYLPLDSKILVKMDDATSGGLTPVAILSGKQPIL